MNNLWVMHPSIYFGLWNEVVLSRPFVTYCLYSWTEERTHSTGPATMKALVTTCVFDGDTLTTAT